MRVALCQIAPVFLDRDATLDKVLAALDDAAHEGAQLAVFGEVMVPGYPIWLDRTGGASFDDPIQKAWHARYLAEGVDIEAGDLEAVQESARKNGIGVVLGVAERPAERGGNTLYCSCVTIGPTGEVWSVHRKLMPTYEERLVWGVGDGHGLRVHELHGFRLGSLNCWENWMPLARHALQAQGETLHCAIWPGSLANTQDITRFAAREGRSYLVSVAAPLRLQDLPEDLPGRESLGLDAHTWAHDGGSCVAGPDGEWVLEPITETEGVFFADLEPQRVREERQNFDPVGHYSRPDVLSMRLNQVRQSVLPSVANNPPDASPGSDRDRD